MEANYTRHYFTVARGKDITDEVNNRFKPVGAVEKLAAFAREYLTGSDAVFDCVIDTPEKIHISEGSCDSRELKRRADRDPEAYARGAQPGKTDIIRDPGKVRGLAEIKLSSTEAFELAANVLDNPALYTDDTVKLMEKISNKMKPSPAPAAAL